MIFKTAIVFLLVCISVDISRISEALQKIAEKGGAE